MNKEKILSNIWLFCDIDWVEEIEAIFFWDLEFWCVMSIHYIGWNFDSYAADWIDNILNTNNLKS
jgi:hypothetical protein